MQVFDQRKKITSILLFTIAIIFSSCVKDPDIGNPIINCGTPFTVKLPSQTPPMPIPEDNPMTVEGIELGRHLFYEKMLSGDNTLACAGCHLQSEAFADVNKFSIGIDGFQGKRGAMPIANAAWAEKYFWDGKTNLSESFKLRRIIEYASFPDLLTYPFENAKRYIADIDIQGLRADEKRKEFMKRLKPHIEKSESWENAIWKMIDL